MTDKGLEITAYVEEEDHAPAELPQPGTIHIKRTIETRLTINPIQMKQFYDLLGKQIEAHESVYCKIASPQEIAEKFAKLAKQNNQDVTTTGTSKPSVGIVIMDTIALVTER